ncbi:hypothetical protein ACFLWL_03255 [Chloroflexota bacterium]
MILSLKPEDEKTLHPQAVKWLSFLRNQIECDVPLSQLNDDDLNMFLTDAEKHDFATLMGKVGRELSICVKKDQATPNIDTWDEIAFKLKVTTAEVNLLVPMNSLKFLLEKVYKRKVAKAREDRRKLQEEERHKAEEAREEQRIMEEQAEAVRRKKEYEERWCAAFVAIDPPVDDAKKYLSDKEYGQFRLAMGKAVGAYLERGVAYPADVRALDYKWWSEEINQRKRREAQKLQAERAAAEYNHGLNQQIAKLTSQLEHNPKDLSSYFRVKIQDRRFTGHNCDYVLSIEDKSNFDGILVSVANKKLKQLIPDELRQFISLPSQYYRLYFPLPTANYSFEEVPSLEFSFEIFAAAYAEVWLKPGKKIFNGYEFSLPLIEGKGYSILLQKPKFLGYYYLIVRPEDLDGYVFWESIPLILLKGLLNGEIKPEGTTISAASDEGITYRIPKIEDEITIPSSFAEYLKTIGTVDKMVSMKILTEKIVSIVKDELTGLKVGQELTIPKDKVKRRDSKKSRIFNLFNQGKRPGNPEVKVLGSKPQTVYRYYQEWKKTQNHL